MSNAQNEISVKPRTEFGKCASRRARKAGMIPAIVYGKGIEARPYYVDAREWAILQHHDLGLISLNDGENKTSVLVKEVQRNYLKNLTVHIDFQEVKMNEEITTVVPVHALPGDPVGLSQGGVLEQPTHEIEVTCLPGNLPEGIEVDISGIELEESLHVSDIKLPEGVKAVTEAATVVFHVLKPAAAEAEEAAAAAEETE